MPITYYTQEEVDELVATHQRNLLDAKQNLCDFEKDEAVRQWILYHLKPWERKIKDLRQILHDASSMELIRKKYNLSKEDYN